MGMDFGFTNDPTASLVGVWINNLDLYIQEYLYRTMMTTNDIHKLF